MPRAVVIIPCYNEERRLRHADFLAFVDTHPHVGLCFVDDGSRDGTRAVLERLRDERPGRISVLAVTPNAGKAAAIRAGVRHLESQQAAPVFGYWDADLSTPLLEVERLLAVLDAHPDCLLALGSRVKRLGSHIDRKLSRHLLGRVFATLASNILGIAVYDSQCGAKLFRAEAAETMFGDPFLTRWLFDLEMLVRLRNNGRDVAQGASIEVALGTWIEVPGSKLKLSDMINVPLELLRIRRHYNRKS